MPPNAMESAPASFPNQVAQSCSRRDLQYAGAISCDLRRSDVGGGHLCASQGGLSSSSALDLCLLSPQRFTVLYCRNYSTVSEPERH